MGETVTVVSNGSAISGWENVRITRRCEALPNDFELSFSSLDPTTGSEVAIQAQDAVQVQIGGDTVVTGWVDEDGNDAGPESHGLIITGRGKCADLADCSAEGPAGGFVSGATILSLAQMLVAPYPGLSVTAAAGADVSQVIPSFAIQLGDTPAQILDHVARAAQVLVYEGADGNLLISAVGAVSAASGVTYGGNAQRWSVRNSAASRYSDVRVISLTLNAFTDIGSGALQVQASANDAGVLRHRLLYSTGEGLDLKHCQMKATWEINRRAGRGVMLSATVDSWRDEAGTLWTPNTLLPCSGPGLRPNGQATLCLSEVTYRYDDEGGEVSDLLLMPPYAFAIEPVQLQPQLRDVNASDGSGLDPVQ